MAFIRTKIIKGRKYCYLVKGSWNNGKCRQKVIRYLGSYDDIYAKRTTLKNRTQHQAQDGQEKEGQ
ncbi:hypothetical protein J4457_05015 [Candidatus Woesearchaeota archaeon]|nr:hypothetical protein [Candidatus Woesearchaeota archaeon]